jgi:heat shock protein HslJ
MVVQCAFAFAGEVETAGQNPLANTQWRLSSFESSGSSTPVIQGTTIVLKLGADGRVSGNSGCNNYAGDYHLEGDSVSFSRLVSTRRACLNQGANQQETRYLSALESAGRFQLRDDQLIINYGDGKNSLNFVNNSSAPAQSRKE